MTKEELEKEAEEWIKDHTGLIGSYEFVKYDYDSMQKAYLAGAEPREKRIAELEVTNKKISDECHKLVDSLEKKQNEIAELEAQIEKMKCWCNCKNYLSCLEECCRKNISFEKGICYNCKKWELRR